MKKILLGLLVSLCFVTSSYSATKTYTKGCLIGGTSDCLDSIDGDSLANTDRALVITSKGSYTYLLNATSGKAESSPDVIAPDTSPGNKRWIFKAFFMPGIHLPDNAALDQGVTGESNTIKYYEDTYNANNPTYELRHNSDSTITTYTFLTSTTITGTLKIHPGAVIMIASGVTLTINGKLDVLPNQYVFNCAGTGKVNGLKIVYSDWFGAKGDGITSGATNTAAIAKAVSALSTSYGDTEFNFSSGGHYLIAGAIGANFNVGNMIINFNGAKLDYGAGTGTAVKFGEDSPGTPGFAIGDIKAHDVWVTGTSASATGVLVQNLYRSRFYGIHSNVSGYAMRIQSLGGGAVYFNEYYGIKLYNAHILLYLDVALHASGYMNNQDFFGGNIYGTLPTPAGSRGIEITDTNAVNNRISGIKFYGTGIEPIVGTTTGRKILDNGQYNLYDDNTFDVSSGGTDIEFPAGSQFNQIRGNWTTSIQVITDNGTDNWVNAPNYGISTGRTEFVARASNAYIKMSNTGIMEEGLYAVKRQMSHFANISGAAGTVNLPTLTGTSGMLWVSATESAGAGAESGFWLVAPDGSVQKISGTTNTAAGSVPGTLCVVDVGTRASILNRLVYTADIVFKIIYF